MSLQCEAGLVRMSHRCTLYVETVVTLLSLTDVAEIVKKKTEEEKLKKKTDIERELLCRGVELNFDYLWSIFFRKVLEDNIVFADCRCV